MNFSTQVPIQIAEFPIHYQSKLVTFGSCFADTMGEKLNYYKFPSLSNPFGIIFNPVSIANILERVANQRFFTEADLFYHQELWHCFEVHSVLSHTDKNLVLNRLNQILEEVFEWISNASHCILTLGTSWVYRNIETNQIVANCHKVPGNQFKKELLSIQEIQENLTEISTSLKVLNPNINFIFTVSPVRHLKDGFVENQISKAHLIAALHQSFNFDTPHFDYFPSFEIMMDELRDYRFYAEDMMHPNELAINYIWEQFSKAYFSGETFQTMKEVALIQKGLAHRPFNPDTKSHQLFLEQLQNRIQQLKIKHPTLNF